jgi:protein-S-isoprenylcysteine O-methyltransferase Ste14
MRLPAMRTAMAPEAPAPTLKKLDWTLGVIIATFAAGALLAAAARHVERASMGGGPLPVGLGISIVVAGAALRIWAVVTLGRFFKLTVTIQPDHHVVEVGPYRRLRHPSYTGLLLILAGVGIALANWLSLLALVALPLAGILIRIRAEEAALMTALGESYAAYATRTARLIPGVW